MKQQHQTFIIEMIKHGDKTMAYQKAYPKCTDEESARKSAERLLRHHPDVSAEIEEATAQIRHQAYTEAYRLYTEQQKTKLLSIMDKREILARIAKCEIKVCRYIKDGDRYRMLFEDPHPREIMKAIEADGRIEDRCNRARNLYDPKLSQFNVYIDGRPCDDPTAAVNPDLPPGLVMLPRTRNLNTEQGNNLEQSQEKDSFPVFREGGTNEVSDGRVDARRTLAQDETLIEEHGNISEHLSRQGGENELSPAACPDHFGRGGGEARAGGGPLAPGKSLIEEQGIITEHLTYELHHTSPPKFIPPSARGVPIAIGIGVQLALENSPLYAQYLALYQKRKLQAEDLMCASFYSQNKAAEAAAPPPHILTDEEVRQFHAEADRQLAEKNKQPKQPYNTFGKMYFPPEGRNPSK